MIILNSEIVNTSADCLIACGIITAVLGLILLLFGIDEDENRCTIIGFIGVLTGIFLLVSAVFDVGLTSYTSYTITFDEENPISAQEFLEKYEVLEVEGKIYTIREREAQK